MVLNIATLFFFRGKPEDPEKNPLIYLSPSDHQFSDVFFFNLFSFFIFPLIFFFQLFPLSYFLYSLLPHITSKMPMLQFKTVNIYNIILHRHFVRFFSFPAPPFSLFDNPVRHVLFFGLSAPLSFVFLSRSQNTYCLMVCISEYVSEDKLFMCRI